MAIAPGTKIGPYIVLHSLGTGGMAEVYLARDAPRGRKVALKLLSADFTKDADRVQRFQREARAASALNHPNLITIFEIGAVESVHFIATEFIEGETLRSRMASARMSNLEICDIAIQVASALTAAHSAGIAHRDIKPENIMVRPDGVVKVLDFGVAKLSAHPTPGATTADPATTTQPVNPESGVVMGTVSYMSPEQVRGMTVDARTDIFSFGVVLYELIAGRVPFEGTSFSDTISGILNKNPAPLPRYAPDVEPELERIVGKSLAKDREERYQNFKELLIDLKRLKAQLDFLSEPRYSEEHRYTTGATPAQAQVHRSGASAARPCPSVAYESTDEDVAAVIETVERNPIKKGRTITLWYGTNRALIRRDNDTVGYSSDRASQVNVGRCLVYVPESHKIGSLGSPWWKRLLRWRDDRLKLLKTSEIDSVTYWREIKKALDKLGEDDCRALVYIHGFNVSFEEAALRAAQLGSDLGVRGIMGFYSWPSKGTLLGYEADGASIDASEHFIADYLASLATQTGAGRIHVIAHSMGNRGLLRAMHRILERAEKASKVRFGQIFLAAPDVDRELFLNLADCYPKLSTRTTLYISDKDRALRSSGILHDFPRAGFTPPVTIAPGIDTVEVSDIDLTLLGHGFFADARDVLHDMHNLIMHNAAPERRMGLTKNDAHDGTGPYWSIKA